MLRNLVLFIGGLLFAWVLSETVLWTIDYSDPSFYGPDSRTGFRLRPDTEGWWRSEGEAYVEINSHGQRDRERTVAKAEGIMRIAVLGDSYSEAMQVPIEQTFWSVAEEQMNSGCRLDGEEEVEFMNFGVAGYGTAQELLVMRHRALEFDPDVVVLALFTGNDIRNNSRRLEGDLMRPYFELVSGELVLDEAFLGSREYRFRQGWIGQLMYSAINRLRVLQLVNGARRRLRVIRQQARRDDFQEVGLSDSIYRAPEAGVWQDAWEVTEALIQRMAAEIRESGLTS